MYRELGHDGLALDQREGPYTGPPRTFSQSALPPDVLARLMAVLDGTSSPSPILARTERASARPTRVALGVMAAALAALAALAARHFAHPTLLLQGPLYAPLYALAGAALLVAAGVVWRERHARLGRRGTYLLPLDILEVGADTITVSPLGSVRRVTVEGHHGSPSLVFTFSHGARHVFPVASERDAELAHEALELSQEHLELLSRSLDLEKALDLDPFFSLRGTGRTGQASSAWSLASPLPRAARAALLAAVGAGAGLCVWNFRNLTSDQALFDRTEKVDTGDAYAAYLAVGKVQRELATQRRDQRWALEGLRAETERLKTDEQFLAKRERVAAAFEAEARRSLCEPVVLPTARPDEAADCYERRATRSRPEVAAWLKERILRSTPLRVRLTHSGAPRLSDLLDAHEAQLFATLRQILGEVAPAAVLPVVRTAAPDADLRIATRVTPGPSPLAATYVFTVTLATPRPVTFELTMPPPSKMPLALRVRSLYTVREPDPRVDPPVPPRDAQLMSARAHDRLYDEVYGLFFDGNPRVPLAPAPAAPSSAPAASSAPPATSAR